MRGTDLLDRLVELVEQHVIDGVDLARSAGDGDQPRRLRFRGDQDEVRGAAASVPDQGNLRPSKIQNNPCKLTSQDRTRDRYAIRGYASTDATHGHNMITVLRDAITGRPWLPALPAPTDHHSPNRTHRRPPADRQHTDDRLNFYKPIVYPAVRRTHPYFLTL